MGFHILAEGYGIGGQFTGGYFGVNAQGIGRHIIWWGCLWNIWLC